MGIFGFGKKEKTSANSINWLRLNAIDELDQLIQEASHEKTIVFFKHSTRCSISAMALNRIEQNWDLDPETVQPVYLDLIQYRPISNAIAEKLAVQHESPQLIVVKNGQVKYHASHNQIDVESIKGFL